MAKNHFFFDMDGTICESKQVISDEVKKALQNKDIYVISGASYLQMQKQLDGLQCTILAQSGNYTDFWKNKLSVDEAKEAYKHILKIKKSYPDFFTNKRYRELIQNRGCQISFSFIGHDSPLTEKVIFDPDRSYRKQLLAEIPFSSRTMLVSIAGTTCLDYMRKDATKGKNIQTLIELHGLNPNECIYFGDALFAGGNDESVKGIIETVEVENPLDTLKKLEQYV